MRGAGQCFKSLRGPQQLISVTPAGGADDRVDPQDCLQHQAVIVGAVLNILAVRTDLFTERAVEPGPAEGAPAGSLRMVRRGVVGGEEGGRLGDEVIVVLRTRVDQRGRDALRMLGDGMRQPLASCRAGGGCCSKDLRGPA